MRQNHFPGIIFKSLNLRKIKFMKKNNNFLTSMRRKLITFGNGSEANLPNRSKLRVILPSSFIFLLCPRLGTFTLPRKGNYQIISIAHVKNSFFIYKELLKDRTVIIYLNILPICRYLNFMNDSPSSRPIPTYNIAIPPIHPVASIRTMTGRPLVRSIHTIFLLHQSIPSYPCIP